jgi:hypothetical protein
MIGADIARFQKSPDFLPSFYLARVHDPHLEVSNILSKSRISQEAPCNPFYQWQEIAIIGGVVLSRP